MADAVQSNLFPNPPMNNAERYRELEAAIMRKVYPEAVYDEQYGEWAMSNGNGGFFLKTIGLEDVLLAVMEKGVRTKYGDWKIHGTVDGFACFYSGNGEALGNWELGKSLSDQSDECKMFLHSLLAP